MVQIVFPLALILGPIIVSIRTCPMHRVVLPLANVEVSIMVNVEPEAVFLSIQPVLAFAR